MKMMFNIILKYFNNLNNIKIIVKIIIKIISEINVSFK
jgi:hypothetical protein